MTFIPSLAPDTPEWLKSVAFVLDLFVVLSLGGWAMVLESQYLGPYTLAATPGNQKWRRAIVLALLQTNIIPLMGLIAPVLSPLPDQWPFFPLFCGVVWVVILPFVVLFKRWDMERQLSEYRKVDAMIKQGLLLGMSSLGYFGWTKFFVTKEQKRFYVEGYSVAPQQHIDLGNARS